MLLVVYIALFHFKDGIQVVGGDNSVSHPSDVANEVLVSLVDLHIDIHVVIVVVADGIFNDACIAETEFVVLVNQCLFGLTVTLVGKLFRLEEVRELSCLVDLSKGTLAEKRTLDFTVLQLIVTFEDELVNLHLLLLVNLHVENHLIGLFRVVALGNFYLGVLIAFLVEISLCQDLRTVDHVRSDLTASHDTQFSLHILALSLLDADIVDATDAWTHAEVYAEVDLAAHDGVGGDTHLREESVAPVTFHCFGNLGAGHFYLLAYAKT